MDKPAILAALEADVDRYVPECAESVRRNAHMNQYDGGALDPEGVGPWLKSFCRHFVDRYRGSQRSGDVMMGMSECARGFRRSGLDTTQAARDAVLVDFINWVAARRCGMDLGLYTLDVQAEPAPAYS